MKLGTLFTINAVIGIGFGFGFVFIPVTFFSYYGVELTEVGLVIGQSLGAAFFGTGILSWLVRNSDKSEVLRAIVLSAFIVNTIGFIVTLKGQLAGIANTLGWSVVAIYAFLAIGYGYFHFQKKDSD